MDNSDLNGQLILDTDNSLDIDKTKNFNNISNAINHNFKIYIDSLKNSNEDKDVSSQKHVLLTENNYQEPFNDNIDCLSINDDSKNINPQPTIISNKIEIQNDRKYDHEPIENDEIFHEMEDNEDSNLEPLNDLYKDNVHTESIDNYIINKDSLIESFEDITDNIQMPEKKEKKCGKILDLKLFRFPINRIKFLMKCDPDVVATNNEGVLLIGKATELFISYLTNKVYLLTLQSKRKTIQKLDFDSTINNFEEFLFLEGIFEA